MELFKEVFRSSFTISAFFSSSICYYQEDNYEQKVDEQLLHEKSESGIEDDKSDSSEEYLPPVSRSRSERTAEIDEKGKKKREKVI